MPLHIITIGLVINEDISVRVGYFLLKTIGIYHSLPHPNKILLQIILS